MLLDKRSQFVELHQQHIELSNQPVLHGSHHLYNNRNLPLLAWFCSILMAKAPPSFLSNKSMLHYTFCSKFYQRRLWKKKTSILRISKHHHRLIKNPESRYTAFPYQKLLPLKREIGICFLQAIQIFFFFWYQFDSSGSTPTDLSFLWFFSQFEEFGIGFLLALHRSSKFIRVTSTTSLQVSVTRKQQPFFSISVRPKIRETKFRPSSVPLLQFCS